MSKTNIEYLRDILADNDEGLEFLEAIENEVSENVSKLSQKDKEIASYEDHICEPEYENTIEAGIGKINWEADNLQLQLVMESLEEKLKSSGPMKVLQLLAVRPKATMR